MARKHTIGEFITAVLSIKDEISARGFVEAYLRWLQRHPHPNQKHTTEEIMRANIGWCFGEGMPPERIAMWSRVCKARHPALGVQWFLNPDQQAPDDALEAGKSMARSRRK